MSCCTSDRQLAAEQGIVASDITRRSSSRSLPANVNARHARFAAACAVDETVCEQPAGAVAQKWGRIGLLKGGECRNVSHATFSSPGMSGRPNTHTKLCVAPLFMSTSLSMPGHHADKGCARVPTRHDDAVDISLHGRKLQSA